jgi:hypothetical protein
MTLLLASLLLAATASAPVLAPETLSPAMGASPVYAMAGPSSTAVRDGDGFLLAFTALDPEFPRARVFVTRLDAFGRMAGALHKVPLATNEGTDAVLPSIAAAPGGYWIVQMEQTTSAPGIGTIWCVSGDQTQPVTRLDGRPVFVRENGGKVFVSTFSQIVQYALDGTLTDVQPSNNADDAVVIGGKPLPVAHLSLPPLQCYMAPCGDAPQYGKYNVLVGVHTAAFTRLPFVSDYGIGAATDGATVLAAFYAGDPRQGEVQFMRFDPSGNIVAGPHALGTFPGDPLQQPLRPAVAFDGVRYVAVWQTGRAIAAAAIDADGNVTPIALPQLGDDSLPNVAAAGRGKFLLSYGAVRNGEWHLATRMLYFDLGRRPVARR